MFSYLLFLFPYKYTYNRPCLWPLVKCLSSYKSAVYVGEVILYTLTNTSQRYYIFLKYASFSLKKNKKNHFLCNVVGKKGR